MAHHTHAGFHDRMSVLDRLRNFWHQALPTRCAVAGCPNHSELIHTHCLNHIVEIRGDLGGKVCHDPHSRCVEPALYWDSHCPAHLRAELRQSQKRDPNYQRRPAVPAHHHKPVPGLTVIYDAHTDPVSPEMVYPSPSGMTPIKHRTGPSRRRVYLFAYVDTREVGHLSYWLHPGETVRIKKIDVDPDYQRRGIASALYETLRAEHPTVLVEHGFQSEDGKAWWIGYCSARGLDPGDPAS